MELRLIIGLIALTAVILLGLFTRKKEDIRMPIIEDRVKLLPYWFKSIGHVFTIISIISILIKHSFDLDIDVNYLVFVLVFSLLIISISAEKEEDEMYKQLRQNAIYYSFFGQAVGLLFFCAISFTSEGNSFFQSDEYPELKIVFIQLIVYLGKYSSLKRRMKQLNSLEV